MWKEDAMKGFVLAVLVLAVPTALHASDPVATIGTKRFVAELRTGQPRAYRPLKIAKLPMCGRNAIVDIPAGIGASLRDRTRMVPTKLSMSEAAV
jgi:hypothetical protein